MLNAHCIVVKNRGTMHSKDEIKKELEELSPFLAKLKAKEDPFNVPSNYFDNLADQVMAQIKEEEEVAAPKVVSQPTPSWIDRLIEQLQLLLQPQYALQLASVAILLAAGAYFFWPSSSISPGNIDEIAANISEDELIQYVQHNIDDFEVSQFVDAGIQEVNFDLFLETEINSEEMDQLMDDLLEDLDESSLEELL